MHVQSLTIALWATSALAAPMLVKRQKAENTCTTNIVAKGLCAVAALPGLVFDKAPVPWPVCKEGTDALPLCKQRQDPSNFVWATGTLAALAPNGDTVFYPPAEKDKLPAGTYREMEKDGDWVEITLGVGRPASAGGEAPVGVVVPSASGYSGRGGGLASSGPASPFTNNNINSPGQALIASNNVNNNNVYGQPKPAESTGPVFRAGYLPDLPQQQEGAGEGARPNMPFMDPTAFNPTVGMTAPQFQQAQIAQAPAASGRNQEDLLRKLRDQREKNTELARSDRERAERDQRNRQQDDRRNVVVDTQETRSARQKPNRSVADDWDRMVGARGAYSG